MGSEQSLPLEDHELIALGFLQRRPGHVVGPIDTEEKMAAAFTLNDLRARALVIATLTSEGPAHYLSALGKRVLEHEADRIARIRIEKGLSTGGVA